MNAAAGVPAAARPWWREPALGLLLLWLVATIGVRPLLQPDEGRYASVALAMMRGDGLVPLLDGLPFFHKPPLLYWIGIGAMHVFGVTVFAVRLAPALLGVAMGASLFLHLRRWHGPAVARIGLVVLATSPFFFIGAQYVNHDVGVAACITAAVLAAVRAVDDPRRAARGWVLAAWALCGLGVLAKGLIGVVLPLLVVGPWLLAQRRWRSALALLHPVGLLVFAAVALPWMLDMQWRHWGFFDYFIVQQHFRRFETTGFNNQQPAWFFIVLLPLLMLPWSLWLWPALKRGGARAALYLWWIVVVVGFFSLPASKLAGYVMPALAPMAALLALALHERAVDVRRWGLGAALFCVAIVVALAWRAPGSHRDAGRVLAERRQAGDRVVYVEQNFTDLGFYAGIAAPDAIVSNWDDPALPTEDNWRRELFDAARFDPSRGRRLLLGWSALPRLACESGRTWFVTSPENVARLMAAAPLEPSFAGAHATLLRADPARCNTTGPAP